MRKSPSPVLASATATSPNENRSNLKNNPYDRPTAHRPLNLFEPYLRSPSVETNKRTTPITKPRFRRPWPLIGWLFSSRRSTAARLGTCQLMYGPYAVQEEFDQISCSCVSHPDFLPPFASISPTQCEASRNQSPERQCLLPAVFSLLQGGYPSLIVGTMADHGAVILVKSKEEWDSHLGDSENSAKVIVVDFTASWCGPCRIIAPLFAELSTQYPNIVFLKVDIDEVQEVAEQQKISAMPTFQVFKGGKKVNELVGASQAKLKELVASYA